MQDFITSQVFINSYSGGNSRNKFKRTESGEELEVKAMVRGGGFEKWERNRKIGSGSGEHFTDRPARHPYCKMTKVCD